MTLALDDTMYTLGQLTRAIWPAGEVPPAVLDVILVKPATGLALAINHKHALRADQDAIATLVAKLPADLRDPVGGIKLEHQGPFWTGYYHYLAALEHAKAWGPAQLERAGNLLYGDRWQTDLARALQVNDRRVRQWIASERPIPVGVWADIAGLLRQRQREGVSFLHELAGSK